MDEYHIIYVPGFGDPNKREEAAVGQWKKFGVTVHYHPLIWSDGELFAPKFERLLKLIDELHSHNYTISLVGTSAGASAAINAFAKRPEAVSGLVCICGKIQNLQTIGAVNFEQNPAFKDSVDLLPASLQSLDNTKQTKIMSIHPLIDGRVNVADTFIEGARTKIIPTIGHVVSIAYAITLGRKSIIRFLKATASSSR